VVARKKANRRARSESQSRAANCGSALPSYTKEVVKEFISKSDRKLARNNR
jgi:hypothetical protein